MADYARNELGFKTEMTYILLAPDASRQWDWQGSRTQAGVESDLRQLLAFDSSFHVLIAHGRSDMVTPYGMTRYVDRPSAGDRRGRPRYSSSSIAAAT